MSIQAEGAGASPRTWAVIVWGLYLGGLLLFVTPVIGVIIAYVKRGDLAGTPFETHMISAIRTFWIALLASLSALVLAFAGIGVILLLGCVVWWLFRVIRGLIRALDGKPIDDPIGWL
jgi:uncharacterized membrane protein